MFSNPAQAPASYNLNAALSHHPAAGAGEAARDLGPTQRAARESAPAAHPHQTNGHGHHHHLHNHHQHHQPGNHNHQHHSHHPHQHHNHHLQQQQQQPGPIEPQLFIGQAAPDSGQAPNGLSAASFFHQSVVGAGQAGLAMAGGQHQAHQQQPAGHPQQLGPAGGHSHHFERQPPQPQLACVNVVNADSFTNHLASAGHVIFDQTNGLLRIGTHPGVLTGAPGQAAIVVNAVGELRQHEQTALPTFAICDSGQYGALACQAGADKAPDQNNNTARPAANGVAGGPAKGGARKRKGAGAGGGAKRTEPSRPPATGPSQDQNQARGGESPRRSFACPTCHKGFTEKFNMKRHMQVHSQSRPKYVCNECSKSFAWKDNFIRHKKAAHNAAVAPPVAS